jgi:hypothetical protein
MSFAGDVRAMALDLADLLETERIPYALMGGLVFAVWGVPRATYDIDMVLSADDRLLESFVSLARRRGLELDSTHLAGFRDVVAGMEKIRLERWTVDAKRIEVDVFLVTTPYQAAAFARRRPVSLDGRRIQVLSAADLVLHKLVAGRPKDLADVLNILAVQGVPDAEYLWEWGRHLGVATVLARLIDDTGASRV